MISNGLTERQLSAAATGKAAATATRTSLEGWSVASGFDDEGEPWSSTIVQNELVIGTEKEIYG